MRGKPLTKNTHSISNFAENKRLTRKPIAPHPPSPSPREFELRFTKFQVNSSEFTRRGGAYFIFKKPEVSPIRLPALAALTTGLRSSISKAGRSPCPSRDHKWQLLLNKSLTSSPSCSSRSEATFCGVKSLLPLGQAQTGSPEPVIAFSSRYLPAPTGTSKESVQLSRSKGRSEGCLRYQPSGTHFRFLKMKNAPLSS